LLELYAKLGQTEREIDCLEEWVKARNR